jgi:hypothetical protein
MDWCCCIVWIGLDWIGLDWMLVYPLWLLLLMHFAIDLSKDEPNSDV